jgi:Lon protease-like protein
MDEEGLPLFVLPMVLFPGELQELRVFEPRYRQMLDTCILDERPFGLVLNDPFEPTNGWDGPRRHGCEAIIVNHETRGMNHFITISGGRRFFIEDVIEPALPPLNDPSLADLVEHGIAPDVHSLLQRIPEDHPHHRLYISANVSYLGEEGVLSQEEQDYLRLVTSRLIHRAGQGMNVDSATLENWVSSICEEQISEQRASVYNVAALCLNDLEARQQLLACTTAEEAVHELRQQLEGFVHEDE